MKYVMLVAVCCLSGCGNDQLGVQYVGIDLAAAHDIVLPAELGAVDLGTIGESTGRVDAFPAEGHMTVDVVGLPPLPVDYTYVPVFSFIDDARDLREAHSHDGDEPDDHAWDLAGPALEEDEDGGMGSMLMFGDGDATDLGLRQASNFQTEGHVFRHRHVRPDRVALEDHGHSALLGRQRGAGRGDHLAVHLDGALRGVQEPRDHPERGGLPAAGRPQEGDELALLERQGEVVHGGDAPEGAAHVAEDELAHAEVRRSMKSRPTSRKPSITSETVITTRISPIEARISKLPSSLLSKRSTESTCVPVV